MRTRGRVRRHAQEEGSNSQRCPASVARLVVVRRPKWRSSSLCTVVESWVLWHVSRPSSPSTVCGRVFGQGSGSCANLLFYARLCSVSSTESVGYLPANAHVMTMTMTMTHSRKGPQHCQTPAPTDVSDGVITTGKRLC